MSSGLAHVETEISSASTSVLRAIDTKHRATSTDLAVLSESVHDRLESLERLVMTENERTGSDVDSQALSRFSGPRLLGTPARLRDACDVVDYSSATTLSRASRQHRMVLSFCGCDLRGQTRSVTASTIHIAGAFLSNEHCEVSKHFKSCPFYSASKEARRRMSVSFGTITWPQLSVLVQASLTCTTGAGGFSISPHLSFRTIIKDCPAEKEIIKFINERMFSMSGADVVKSLDILERKIWKMFQAGETSPHYQFPNGTNLLHARSSIPRILL